LADILKQHAAWVKDGGPLHLDDPKVANDPRRANLCGAQLTGADLNGTNLNGADLVRANLTGAYLTAADLGGAYLNDAYLAGAHLDDAHLDGAHLIDASLDGADLSGAHVSKARLAYSDLTDALYAPESEPPDPYVAGIKGLATVNAVRGEEIGLIQLRKLLQDAGLRFVARQAPFSIQRNITRDQLSSPFLRSAWIAGALRTVGLEWTTAYGMRPQRALLWILLLGVIVTPVYIFATLRPTAESGIIKVFPGGRLDGTAGNPADEEKSKKHLVRAQRWRDALSAAAYFCLLSAVNIGFEQFTPGDWIRRLQRRAYSLEAVGWVRVVAGVQSLLSLYLLAMWVLTQFGQPFE
jgi:uncharacterized protein YjbI with pentapeptide repeats